MSSEAGGVRLPSYRLIVSAKTGDIINTMRIEAKDDEQAIELARAIFDGHAVELWDGLRFIEHFPPVE